MKTQHRLLGAAIAGILASPVAVQAFGNIPPQCSQAIILHVPCTNMTTNASLVWSGNITTPAKTMPWQGNTVATVHSQFPVVINWEFETETAAALNAQINKLTPLGLARFSHHYYLASGGNIGLLMQLAAQKLTAANLVRWNTAFGQANTDTAVNDFSPATIKAQYLAAAKPAALPQSHAAHIIKGTMSIRTMNGAAAGVAAPSVNMTISEIFEEYLWTSAETELGAYALTAVFVKVNLGKALLIGYQIGSTFYGFAESIDPSYGYDLVTEYGGLATDYQGELSETTGTGYVDMANMVEWNTAGADAVNWDYLFE
jgi:hypothetical protein